MNQRIEHARTLSSCVQNLKIMQFRTNTNDIFIASKAKLLYTYKLFTECMHVKLKKKSKRATCQIYGVELHIRGMQ